jgi:hypothetical protein
MDYNIKEDKERRCKDVNMILLPQDEMQPWALVNKVKNFVSLQVGEFFVQLNRC